ncbi:hypothetical protein QTA56_03410 [Acinetobacter sp. VNH17]|uniref:Uncharacterized protein n=1 Tax=Acinetobacter thutiue TaxID=2998078 RepID=A0ABT7WKS2_9GAMM|nr:hypothetical protein [Acinetobacter thutiue]MCY6411186.1 hypothetical protein [Acinetobacter thutiue]MDN0013288.1 hypothetical protein [Acinetobacter thutiue]
MGFIMPQTDNILSEIKTLKAFGATNISVKYRDTSSISASTKQVTADKLGFDLTQGFDEQILSGSVRFKLGADTFIDRTGLLYRNVDSATGSGIQSGTIQYGTGIAEFDSWTPNVDNQLTLQSLTTTTDMLPIHHVSFRTPTIPIRPGSLTVVVAAIAGSQLILTADEAGIIETAQAHGFVNYETGFVDIYFYVKTEITGANRDAIEAEEWYLPQLEFTEAGKTYINVPYWIDATSVRYNAIAYTYIPLDSEILGLSATRLPPDGRVPIFRVGDIGVIASSKKQELPSHVAGQTYQLDDQRISWCELEDSNGVKVPFDMYVVDYDYGRVTLSGDFALNALVAPISAAYRYQDMGLINDVQINGQITLTKPVTHNYDADNSIVGSALVVGDMFSRYTSRFVQETWNNVWADVPSGAGISANYNDALYPIQITNKGAIQERWALVFTDNANFRIIGEVSGQIDTGNLNSDCAPMNPTTNAPYFKVKKEGWGTGWASGNVLRFNTVAAMYPIWCIRTVKQSEPTTLSDNFQIMFRGDIDR